MIKSIGKLSLVTILTALVMGVPVTVSAQDKTTPAPSTPAPASAPKAVRFSGKLGSVDKVNLTITVDDKTKTNRVFQITSSTKITKGGKPATLADGVLGEAVGGSYLKDADGKLTARTVRFGAAAAAP